MQVFGTTLLNYYLFGWNPSQRYNLDFVLFFCKNEENVLKEARVHGKGNSHQPTPVSGRNRHYSIYFSVSGPTKLNKTVNRFDIYLCAVKPLNSWTERIPKNQIVKQKL